MIESFRVQNYKALRDVEVKLTPMHVLIGPNDSGKTSILEALGALCRSVDLGIDECFRGFWNGKELAWDENSDVVLGAQLNIEGKQIRYELECQFPPTGRDVKISRESAGEMAFRNGGTHYSVIQSTWRSGRATAPDDLLKSIHHELSGVQYYRWNPRFLALANAQTGASRFQMDSGGLGLALCLDDILGYDRDRFQALEDRYRQIFPAIESIKLVRQMGYQSDGNGNKDVPVLRDASGKGIYFKFAQRDALVPAAQVSDGVLLVLAYLAVLYSPEPPRLLMVEEPENGIHPKRLKEVLKILRELVSEQSHTQVLMTTHSPYVLDEFRPEEVTLCQKGEDGAVRVRQLSDVKAVREQLDVFSLGEIWTSEGDEALAADSNGAGGTK